MKRWLQSKRWWHRLCLHRIHDVPMDVEAMHDELHGKGYPPQTIGKFLGLRMFTDLEECSCGSQWTSYLSERGTMHETFHLAGGMFEYPDNGRKPDKPQNWNGTAEDYDAWLDDPTAYR